jgi:adenylate cyclase
MMAAMAPVLPWLVALDYFAFDAWHRLAGQNATVTRTAIVAIDDASLARFSDTPLAFWQPQLGAAIATLHQAGVKVIGVDLIQAISAETWLTSLGAGDTPAGRTYEAPYRAVLVGGNIVLAAARAAGADEADLWPPAEHVALLAGGADDLGLVNLEADADGFVRHLVPVLANSSPTLSFAARLVLAVKPDSQFPARTLPIPFAGPPGTIPRVSLASLTEPGALQNPRVLALRDRVVIIAADATRLQDLHLTPYARALPGLPPQLMTGGEVHAQAVEAWLANRHISVTAAWLSVTAAAAMGLLLGVIAQNQTPLLSAAVATLMGVGSVLVSAVLFMADIWLAPIPLLLGVAGAWSAGLVARAGGEARARIRLRQLFGRYVSDEVAELAVRDALPDVGGAATDVTVLFLDIRNFTALSEKLNSREVFELLNAWLPLACDPILAERGNVDKFIGDGVMAVFGSPLPLADHAGRAVKAACLVAQAADAFAIWVANRFAGRGLPPFAIGIGLHSGPVLAGNLGTARRVEFTVIGDTVNVASRLESASKDLGWRIVASAATVRAAGEGLALGARQTIALKGKVTAVDVLEIRYRPDT